MIKYFKRLIPVLLSLMLAAAVVGCDKQGPAENAGEKIDEQVEKTHEAIDKKVEQTREGIEKAGDKIEK